MIESSAESKKNAYPIGIYFIREAWAPRPNKAVGNNKNTANEITKLLKM